MQTAKLTLTLEVDGVPVPGFPVTRRLNLDELQSFNYEKAFDGIYTDIPAGEVASIIQLLAVQTQKTATIRLNAQSDAGLKLAANGLLVIFDGVLDSGSAKATISNTDVGSALTVVKGIAAGT